MDRRPCARPSVVGAADRGGRATGNVRHVVTIRHAPLVGWFGMFGYAMVLAGIAWAVGAVSTVAAVLNLRGARLRHRLASLVTIALAALVMGWGWFGQSLSTVLLAGLSLSQLTVMRLFSLPRWRIRPATKRGRGASITFLLTITAAAAAVAAGAAQIDQLTSLVSWGWLLLVLAACLLGQLVSAVVARRWAELGGGVGGGAVILLALLALPSIGGSGIIASQVWNVAIGAASAYVASWTIGYFHRCDQGRRTVPTLASSPTAVAGASE